MLPYHVALVSDTPQLSLHDLLPVSAALQKQVTRDFGPLWGIDATVSAFAALEDVPLDYWPVIVRDDIQTPGAAGVHDDDSGQPFALAATTRLRGRTVTRHQRRFTRLTRPIFP